MKKATGLALTVLILVTVFPWRPAVVHAQGVSALEEIQKRGTVRIGWSVWIPYFYRDSKTNKITGFSVELMDDLAKEMRFIREFSG